MFLRFTLLVTLVVPSIEVSSLHQDSLSSSTLLLLDVDNTLYCENQAGIEAQIVKNTHSYCLEKYGLDKEAADELFREYGTTVEGLKQTLWKDWSQERLQDELEAFYHGVYKNDMDYSQLIANSRVGKHGSTGYTHPRDRELLYRLLQSKKYRLGIMSNSPSWHVEKTLKAMGLSEIQFQYMFTPDRHPGYPTKSTPKEYFGPEHEELKSYGLLVLFDDSKHNLDRICECFPTNTKPIYIQSNENNPLANDLLCEYGLVDDQFKFDQVRYLEAKNLVDRQSIHVETWNQVIEELSNVKPKNEIEGIHIADVGAGLLSVLDLILHGDSNRGLRSLVKDKAFKGKKLFYKAFESNRLLFDTLNDKLLSWGFKRIKQVSNEEYLFEKENIQMNLILRDYGSGETESRAESPPHLIIGCCFADLMDPDELAASLVHSFNILESETTLVYFPITFCGTTQFLPPKPFEKNDGEKSTIPSDTVAFGLYSQALVENLGHNIHPIRLQDSMERYGAHLERKRSSNWKIDAKHHTYLFETMLYFFGTAGGPQILKNGWDASGWILRARKHQPAIEVSNVDLLFRFGPRPAKKSITRQTEYKEIQFTAPKEVTSVKKEIPELRSKEILIKSSHSLISSGTELKIFNGLFDDAALDINIKDMKDERMAYPLAYGYCLVGYIVKVGESIPKEYIGKLVFSFSPHATYIVSDLDGVQIVPDGIAPEDAIFMPSVETALSLVHDAHTRVGENIAVYGQGLIGLLVTSILRWQNQPSVSGSFGAITVFDNIPERLAAASQMGASQALLPGGSAGPFDVSIEVSGNSRALQAAIDNTSNGGRIIVGSWYGNKDVNLKLGIDFHRSHKTIRTSQVSDIPADLLGLWDKRRRFSLTWELVKQIRPSTLLTRKLELDEAQVAYESLDKGSEIAVAFVYN